MHEYPSIAIATKRSAVPFLALLMLLLALSVATPARATVLRQLTLDELVGGSDLIFTGTVVAANTSVEGDLVYTTVRFDISETLHGEIPGDTLELRFLGGESGEQATDVSATYIPAVGQRGLYFVEDTVRDLVNPLVGWSQGYFPLVDTPDGVTWLDLKEHPDYGLLVPDASPLAGKMRGLNFTREQIAERFPEQFRFPLDDFVYVINDLRAKLEQEGE